VYSRKKSAGRQLRRFEASEIHVLTPTVGEWNGRTLSDWSKDVEIPLKKVHLKWISTSHPWAKHDGWTLSTKVNAALGANGVRVEHIPNDERLTENHLDEDGRTLVPPNERGMIGTKVFSRGAFLER
jgi:hypothetical protein